MLSSGNVVDDVDDGTGGAQSLDLALLVGAELAAGPLELDEFGPGSSNEKAIWRAASAEEGDFSHRPADAFGVRADLSFDEAFEDRRSTGHP